MLVTEKEAKERWCPFAQFGSGCNRKLAESSEPLSACMCIASQCMAWRWMPLMADQPFMDAIKDRMESSGDSHPKAVKYVRTHLSDYGLPDKPFRGICGLAGALLK